MINTLFYFVAGCVYVVLLLGCDRSSIQVSSQSQQAVNNDKTFKALGDVFYDTKQPLFAEFEVNNNQLVPMNVRIIGTSCGCVSAGINGDSAALIDPGESALLKISIQPENMYLPNYTQSVTTRVTFGNETLDGYDIIYSVIANILPKLSVVRPGSLPLIAEDSGKSTLDLVTYRKSDTSAPDLRLKYDIACFTIKSTLTGSVRFGNYFRDSFTVSVSIKDRKMVGPTSGVEILCNDSSIWIGIQNKNQDFETRPSSVFFKRGNSNKVKVVRVDSQYGFKLSKVEFDRSMISVVIKHGETGGNLLEIECLDSAVTPFTTTIQLFCNETEQSVGKVVVSSL